MHLSTNFSIAITVLVLLCGCTMSPTSSKDAEVTAEVVIVDDGGISNDMEMNEASMDLGVTEDDGVGSDAIINETTTFQLTVSNGFGSGMYEAGSTVHIWANHNPRAQVVMRWSGDSDVLMDVGEWHTSFVMPSRDLTLNAELTETSFSLIEAQFDGRDRSKTVRYFIPPNPVGLVHITHGTGGSGAIIESVEAGYIARVLVQAGYGVWATDAEEVDAGDLDGNNQIRWNVTPAEDNIDFANLTDIVRQFVDRGLMPAGLPNFIVGMSNGGAFSLVAGHALNLNAAVVYCAVGSARVADVTETPTAWFLCEQDENEQVDNNEAVRNHEALVARDIATEQATHGPSPLYDQRFTRIEGIDSATSADIADELRLNNHVDTQGFLLQDGSDIGASIMNTPSDYPVINGLRPRIKTREVINQLRVMRSNHKMYDDYARRTLTFIQAHTP